MIADVIQLISEMAIEDKIQSFCDIVAIFISIMALLQSRKSNNEAEKANDIAEKANDIAEKANDIANEANKSADYANDLAKLSLKEERKTLMPLVKFTGEIKTVKKSILQLRNEVTFDFEDLILDIHKPDGDVQGEEDEVMCIEAEIKNCGNGIISALKIEELVIKNGNKVSIRSESKEELAKLCDFNGVKCSEEFILLPGKKRKINFIIIGKIEQQKGIDFKMAQDYEEEFFRDNENVIVGMSLSISSLNDSLYKQEFLQGTFLKNKIVHNSFIKAECDTNEK